MGDGDADEDSIIEIYDLPEQEQFEEDPEFEYVSQTPFELKYPFISSKSMFIYAVWS